MLAKALTFLHVAELKALAEQLGLGKEGAKIFLIDKIVHFVQTGKVLKRPHFPSISLAKKGLQVPLAPDSLILKGAYKNDLKTRLFFKSLIGNYFHFTAFGIDWINQQWLVGNPPTYQEFAEIWQKEFTYRQANQAPPKVEWAFINFTKEYLAKKPQATQTELHQAWQKERVLQKRIVESELKKIGIDICFAQK